MPAPFFQAFVVLRRLGRARQVNFLMDTGSDSTMLQPRDISQVGIDYQNLDPATLVPVAGIHGALEYFREEALLVFDQGGPVLWCYVDILICPHDAPVVEGMSSLLGRDFLNLGTLRVNQSRGLVEFEPDYVDDSIIKPLP